MSFARRFTRANGHAVSQVITQEKIARTLASYHINTTRRRRANLVSSYLSFRGYDLDAPMSAVWPIDIRIIVFLLSCERWIYGR